MNRLTRALVVAAALCPLLAGLTGIAGAAGDSTAPTMSSFTRSGNAGVSAPTTIDISYVAADDSGGSGLANVSFIYSTPDGGSFAVSDADPAISGAVAAGSVDNWAAAGTYQLQQAVVQDAAGNRLTYLRDGSVVPDPASSSTVTNHSFEFSTADFTVANANQDVTVPTLTSVSPASPSTAAPGASISVGYAASDDVSGLASAEAELVDGSGDVLTLHDNVPTATGGTLTGALAATSAGGVYQLLTVTLVDNEGNTGYYLAGGSVSRTPSGAAGPTFDSMDFTTDGFTVPAVPTALTVSSSASNITYGGSARLSGRLIRTDLKRGVAARRLTIQIRKHGTTRFTTLMHVTTASDGAYLLTVRPQWNADYRVINPKDAAYKARTATVTLLVRTKVSAALTATKVRHGTAVALYGTVNPAHAGQYVTLQRYVAGTWKNLTSRKLDSNSNFAFVSTPTTGSYVYRVRKSADNDHATGTSRPLKLTAT